MDKKKAVRIWAALALILVLGFAQETVAGASWEDGLNYMVLYDSSGEAVDACFAFAAREGSDVFVVADRQFGSGRSDGARVAYVTDNNRSGYDAELMQDTDVCSLWALQEEPSGESSIYLEDAPHLNEDAYIYYFSIENDELEKKRASVTLTGYQNGLLEVDSYPSDLTYPAPVVNGEEKLVGFVVAGTNILGLGDEETFYGTAPSPGPSAETPSTEAPPAETPSAEAPPAESSAQPPSRETEAQRQTAAPLDFEDDDKEDPEDPDWKLIAVAVVCAALVLAGILVLVFARKKKKKPQSRPDVPAPPVQDEVGPTKPWQDEVGSTKPWQDEIGPTQPGPAFWISAKGGYMNGRMYQMNQSELVEITIGRNPGSTIQYPADTAGVSRVHARLYWRGNDLLLVDCGSTSGTFLQRVGKLTPMAPVVLKDGDVFYIGERKNEFEVTSQTER